MDAKAFRAHAHELVDWMGDYLETIEENPVKSQVKPGEILAQLPLSGPNAPEGFEQIMADFKEIIMPGITHWQSPNFFAYFPANNSFPSLLGEMLMSTLGAQCMIWETSPAAAELEERVLEWLRQWIGLPEGFDGTIQSTASEASLCALLSARERISDFRINQKGFSESDQLRVYISSQCHSSIEKGAKIAGLGAENVVKIPVDNEFRMDPPALKQAIEEDLANGKSPLCVVATLGSTSSTAVDPLESIAAICKEYNIWLHVDAAYAGAALILPEFRWMIKGIEQVDSFVFNPHKWLFTHFDCTAYFVKDKGQLIRTFEILPEYLKTKVDRQVHNYRDWGIPLGRRFRALKLWFVLRNYGLNALQKRIREHIQWVQNLAAEMEKHPDFELLSPCQFNLICFRFHPKQVTSESTLDQLNEQLLQALNQSGKMYLTHTRLNGKYTLRLVAGNTRLEVRHLDQAWAHIQKLAKTYI